VSLGLREDEQPILSVAAGGTITQSIEEDTNDPRIWDVTNSKLLNIQLINSTSFERITGIVAPPTPVSAEIYASQGLPFYEIYQEKPSNVSGDFSKVRTLSTLDAQRECQQSFYYDVHNPPRCAVCQSEMADCL
jgi:hypothetical protein